MVFNQKALILCGRAGRWGVRNVAAESLVQLSAEERTSSSVVKTAPRFQAPSEQRWVLERRGNAFSWLGRSPPPQGQALPPPLHLAQVTVHPCGRGPSALRSVGEQHTGQGTAPAAALLS